jgi:hypothetical protein
VTTVWKYDLPYETDGFTFNLPENAVILHVAVQHGTPKMWVEVDNSTQTTEPRYFRWIGTGHKVPEDGMYIETVFIYGGSLVLHLYEVSSRQLYEGNG